jgi:hypothetical protein
LNDINIDLNDDDFFKDLPEEGRKSCKKNASKQENLRGFSDAIKTRAKFR